MKVLAIYGSPQNDENTTQMLNAAISEYPSEAEIKKVFLGNLKFINKLLKPKYNEYNNWNNYSLSIFFICNAWFRGWDGLRTCFKLGRL